MMRPFPLDGFDRLVVLGDNAWRGIGAYQLSGGVVIAHRYERQRIDEIAGKRHAGVLHRLIGRIIAQTWIVRLYGQPGLVATERSPGAGLAVFQLERQPVV